MLAKDIREKPYKPFGPFRIARNRSILCSASIKESFWDEADEAVAADGFGEIRNAKGCYIFATQSGGSWKPWYVGQAKRTFRQEVFNHHNINKYNEIINNYERAIPVLFLFARLTENRRRFFSRALPVSEANYMEKRLMGLAAQANEAVWNIRDLSVSAGCLVDGVFGYDRRKRLTSAELATRRLLNLDGVQKRQVTELPPEEVEISESLADDIGLEVQGSYEDRASIEDLNESLTDDVEDFSGMPESAFEAEEVEIAPQKKKKKFLGVF